MPRFFSHTRISLASPYGTECGPVLPPPAPPPDYRVSAAMQRWHLRPHRLVVGDGSQLGAADGVMVRADGVVLAAVIVGPFDAANARVEAAVRAGHIVHRACALPCEVVALCCEAAGVRRVPCAAWR